jgi:hypothetical protein
LNYSSSDTDAKNKFARDKMKFLTVLAINFLIIVNKSECGDSENKNSASGSRSILNALENDKEKNIKSATDSASRSEVTSIHNTVENVTELSNFTIPSLTTVGSSTFNAKSNDDTTSASTTTLSVLTTTSDNPSTTTLDTTTEIPTTDFSTTLPETTTTSLSTTSTTISSTSSETTSVSTTEGPDEGTTEI